ncbi:LysM domain-containing protein [Roseimicrobium gellanilyticum]|uniref:LysM domain-containing protein n=1 Tax=Roseimicrobium gellanilyticum TaxID=748857 RepID=A0A366H8C8_9BACT|nr:LysM peptidoglycan-binding domain-containing protein [Roseimicrobium gellanilyticum]RBP37752.1 LysM domain-containing protein [Roseimicrobium gellanilyticum]
MLRFWKNPHSAAACAAAVALMLSLSSCSSNKIEGIPSNLPKITLHGNTSTPSHSLSKEDYPFDSSGRYMSDWAAAGERRAGRSAGATSADVSKWSGSYGGAATGKKRTVAKTSSSKSKSGSKSKVASSSKKGGGRSYTVKKGDTLSAIASRNSTSVAKLKAANGMSSDFLSIGKVLRIP